MIGAKRIFRNMHRHLMMPVKWGVPIVSPLAVLLLVSLATSFVVYWWRWPALAMVIASLLLIPSVFAVARRLTSGAPARA